MARGHPSDERISAARDAILAMGWWDDWLKEYTDQQVRLAFYDVAEVALMAADAVEAERCGR